MASLTATSKRAALFEALRVARLEAQTLQKEVEALQVKKQQAAILPLSDLWEQLVKRSRIHNSEFNAFCKDLYKAGQATRQTADALVGYLK